LERKMLRMALRAARDTLQAYPFDALQSLPAGTAHSKLTLWAVGPRNIAICELTAILGDVPIDQIDVRQPPPRLPPQAPAATREKLNEMKRQLGLPVLKY